MSAIRYFRKSADLQVSPTLNVDGISARLAVTHRAKVDGRNEQPPSSEESVTGSQREIVSYFRGLQRDGQRQATQSAERMRRLSDQIDVAEAIAEIRDVPSQCEREIVRLTLDSQSELISAQQEEARQRQRYDDFCSENDHQRPAPRFTSGGVRVFLMAAIIVVGALAFSMNASIRQGGVGLLPTPWIYALFFVAVIISFWLGRHAFPRTNDSGEAEQGMGWFGAIVGAIISAALAFVSVLYINGVGRTPDTDVFLVLQDLLQTPTAIGINADNWQGPAIVVVAGLLAFLIGYRSDESYLRFGKVQIDFDRAREKHEVLARRLRTQINAIIDKAEVEATQSARKLKSQVRKFSRMVDASKLMPAKMVDYEMSLEDACNILLDRYRTINREHRRTEPPPSFSEHICFRSEEFPIASLFDPLSGTRDEINKEIAGLDNAVRKIRQELRDLNWRAINAVEDPANIAIGTSGA